MKNQLFFGDCLEILEKYLVPQNPEGFIDLVYIDPPFNSKRDYNVLFESADLRDSSAQKKAFADTWSNISYMDELDRIQDLNLDLYDFLKTLEKVKTPRSAVAYLTTMALRIIYIHKVLKSTGSFYLHCDPTMSHYLKIVCDLIFGHRNFKNEIVWSYQRWTNSQDQFQSMHDIILFYSKSKKSTFNTLTEPYSTKSKHKGKRYSEIIDGKFIQSYTEDDSREKSMRDVWEISYLNSQSKERLGYPTQKPEVLLERIIKASSNEGDLVADFFCGCGTTIAAAQRLGRNWLGVDISHLAVKLIMDRLLKPWEDNPSKMKEIRHSIEVTGIPRDIDSAKELARNTARGRFTFQDWVVEFMMGGVVNSKKVGDGGYDGYITYRGLGGHKGVILIEVKSGNVGVKNIREFIQVIQKQGADMGVFVCFKEQFSSGMAAEARHAGYYQQEVYGEKYLKIRVVTVEELLDGYELTYPKMLVTTFKQATDKLIRPIQHGNLFDGGE